MSDSAKNRRWEDFFTGLLCDVRLAAFCIVVLGLLRLFLLVFFHSALAADSGTAEFLKAAVAGLRFDAQVGFYVALPSVVAGIAGAILRRPVWARRARVWAIGIFCGLFPLFAVVTVGYVKEFGDLFNHFVFGVIYDDVWAVCQTVWQENPVVWELCGAALAGWLFTRLGLRLAGGRWPLAEGLAARLKTRPARAAAVLAVFIVLGLAARGGAGRVPVQFRDRDVTADAFLNRMVLNPISALRYTIRDYQKAMEGGDAKRYLGPEGPAGAVRELFPDAGPVERLDDAFRATAKGGAAVRPRHVFLLVVESYDAWPFLEPYRSLGLVNEGERLGRDGILVRSFLTASTGTMTSLSCLMSGLYSPETRINYQRTSRTPYATALGVNFQKLGYRTRLFYGGRLSWQRLGEFARSQGFDETFGQESIAEEGQSNEWGADDGALYDYALKSVPEDVPSFNLILTTTNHPPYSLDLGKVGWKGATLSPELAKIADGDLTDRHMGHLWYTDREIGRFVRAAAEKFRPAVFAVTGDHFSRRFLNKKPTTYEGSAVPLILYGPEVLGSVKVPDRIAGSHLDIAPTLLELCAPAGFSYHTLARNILAPSPLPLAFGRGEVIGPDFILDDAPDAKPEPLPWAALGAPLPASSLSNLAAARDRYRKMVGLSWWRVMKGNDLSKTDK